MAIGVNLLGLAGVHDMLAKANVAMTKGLSDEMNASALKIQSNAKRAAPINLGTLRGSIELTKETELTYSVAATASYAPYVEFGTGAQVSIPSGYDQYAATFKGKGNGTFRDFVAALMLWAKRKGIGGSEKEQKRIAYLIAAKILRNGMRAQPFLIPAFEMEKSKLIQRINKLINA